MAMRVNPEKEEAGEEVKKQSVAFVCHLLTAAFLFLIARW
jgi:hypothetical protein